MLNEFIEVNRDEIIRRCRAKVAARSMPPPTPVEIDHGVPMFLDELQEALRHGGRTSEITQSALRHGHDLLAQGFTVSQVVHDYGDICQSITDLAVETQAPISNDDFRTLNRCLDDAIAGAVTEYGRERNQSSVDESMRSSERLGFFIHEMRNLLSTATYAFEVLRTGNVGVGGSTGNVLQRSLAASRALIARSVSEMRMTHGVQTPQKFLVSGFIEELAAGARLEAEARGLALEVLCLDDAACVDADRQVLASVIGNLLQNAFKYTRSATTVTLRVGASVDRVLIEIQDECGGLPGGNVNDLFRPFEQRGADRSVLGLGLAFSRWAVEANHGRIYARSLPDRGCVFTVDLPRVPVGMIETV
jgi:signal transduction histidine kinase